MSDTGALTGAGLPRFTAEDARDPERAIRKLNDLVNTLEIRLERLERPLVDPREPAAGEEVFSFSNVSEKRTLDADATTVAELADVLGTLLEDLRLEGRLR